MAIVPVFIITAAMPLTAQTEAGSETVNPELESLLEYALSSAEQGNWEQALQALDDAERLDTDDPRINSYRASILELHVLDVAQVSWTEGEPSEVQITGTEADGGEDDDTPKFVIDRGDKDSRNDPAAYRDNLRLGLSIKMFAVNPLSTETINTWSSGNEFIYASLGTDLRYWMPFLGRSLGVHFRSSGYSWVPGEPGTLFNSLDLGINLRGFLLESLTSRLEIGLDFGASLHTVNDVDTGIDRSGALFLGIWVSDPLFFHIFKVDSLERLVFNGGLRIYSSTTDVILETINYRLEGAWYFNRGYGGVRFEWWDFTIESGPMIMMSFSLYGGFRY